MEHFNFKGRNTRICITKNMGFFGPPKYFKQRGLKKEIRGKSPLTRTFSPQEKKFIQQKIGNIKGLASKSELRGVIKGLRKSNKISKLDARKLKKVFGIKRVYRP